jgi:hypothetical protein
MRSFNLATSPVKKSPSVAFVASGFTTVSSFSSAATARFSVFASFAFVASISEFAFASSDLSCAISCESEFVASSIFLSMLTFVVNAATEFESTVSRSSSSCLAVFSITSSCFLIIAMISRRIS